MANRGWYLRFTNGWYGESGGTAGRRLTTHRFTDCEWRLGIEQNIAQLIFTLNINWGETYNWIANGDILEGDDITGDYVAIPPTAAETHTPLSETRFSAAGSFNPLQKGSLVELFWQRSNGTKDYWFRGTVEDDNPTVQAGTAGLTYTAYDLLETYGKALPVGAGTASHEKILPVLVVAPIEEVTGIELEYSPGMTYSLYQGSAVYMPPYDTGQYLYTYPLAITDTITAIAAPTNETGDFGEAYRHTTKITTDRLDASDPLQIPQQGWLLYRGMLVWYNDYGTDGTNQCFFDCYLNEGGTTEDITTGSVFVIRVPKALAPGATSVQYTYQLSSPTLKPLTDGKVDLSEFWGAFVLAEKLTSLEPLVASFAYYDKDGTPSADSDLDSDGVVTIPDFFLKIATGDDDYGGMGLSASDCVFDATLYAVTLDQAQVSVALTDGQPALSVMHSAMREAGLERATVIYYDPRTGKLTFRLQVVDTGAADYITYPHCTRVAIQGSVRDTYLNMLGLAEDLTDYNAICHQFSAFNTADANEHWVYIPVYTTPASDLTSDEGEYLNLVGVERPNAGSHPWPYDVKFQKYSAARFIAEASVRRRILRYLTDDRHDTYYQQQFDPGDLTYPYVFSVHWFNAGDGTGTNADPEELFLIRFSPTLGGSEALDVEIQGTIDPSFDPSDPFNVGVEWQSIAGNLTVRARGDEPYHVVRESQSFFLPAARAIRVYYRAGQLKRIGMGELYVQTRRTVMRLIRATADTAKRGDRNFLVIPEAYKRLYYQRQRVGTLRVGAVGADALGHQTRNALIDSHRRTATRSYEIPFSGSAAQLAAMRQYPPVPASTRRFTQDDGTTADLMVSSASLKLAAGALNGTPTATLTIAAFDPAEVLT